MDITKFCAAEEQPNLRYPISKPWVKDGWRYATDVRIAVREKTDEPDSHEGYPDVAALFAGRIVPMHEAGWKVLPTHDGKGKTWTEPACMVASDPVKSCKQWGKCPASSEYDGKCTNKVSGLTPGDRLIDGQKYGGLYIKLLNDELPGVKYYCAATGVMHFQLGDVEGVLTYIKQ